MEEGEESRASTWCFRHKLENTVEGLLESYELVSDKRFKYWEFDVRESSDGVLFAFHDDSYHGSGKVRSIPEHEI